MRFYVFFFLAFFLLFAVLVPGHHGKEVTDCSDPNEVYLYCGSACPARCGDRPGDRVCVVECVKGCFCKKGLVLNSDNKCVLPDKC